MKIKKIINPIYWYRQGKSLTKSLEWSLAVCGIPITIDARRLMKLKDKHRGKRCFVLGNGPSLNKTDIDLLGNEITFASNKIYLCFGEKKFRPTYYTVEDYLDVKQYYQTINNLRGFTKIFPKDTQGLIRSDKETIFIPFDRNENHFPRFSIDLRTGFGWGSTVTYMNIELAYFMGIREVYLIGVDFSFHVPKKVDGVEVVSSGEFNHFHPDYRQPGERWFLPRLDRQEKALKLAKKVFEENGGVIYNASPGTKLKVFPLVNYLDIIEHKTKSS